MVQQVLVGLSVSESRNSASSSSVMAISLLIGATQLKAPRYLIARFR